MQLTLTVYRRNPRSQWRWRLQSRNRKIVAASSEAFTRLSRCLGNLYLATGFRVDALEQNVKKGRIHLVLEDVRGRLVTGTRQIA